MQSFADGNIEITAADLPSFLYEKGTVYNPDNEVTGLFHGFLLVRVCTYFVVTFIISNCYLQVYRHIFTGPKSALGVQDLNGRNKNKARLFHLKAVTGRTIAYACVQVRNSHFFIFLLVI
jgi:hypothetical protein